jgi:hypothetical protein
MLTYEKLKDVMKDVKDSGFELQISDADLDKIIIKRVGGSDYVIENTKRALGKLGLVRRNMNGLFDILDGD